MTAPPPLIDSEGREIDDSVFFANRTAEDILNIRNQGLDVDNDNEPAPENIPAPGAPSTADNGLYKGQAWGLNGLDYRRAFTDDDVRAGFKGGWSPNGRSYADIFLHLFMIKWLKEVLLVLIIKSLVAGRERSLLYGELLWYIGLWLLMATYGVGFLRKNFWTLKEYDE